MGRPPTKPTTATKLRYQLIGRGSMYRIAGLAGMAPSTLSDYSLGYKTMPARHLIALSDVLGVPEADLVGDVDFDLTP
jgi:hypothetical protein